MGGVAHADLNRIAPMAQRLTNHVYVAPESLVSRTRDPSEGDQGAISFINDDEQLENFLANCRVVDKLERKAAGNVLRNAVNASSLTLPFVKVDFAKWSAQNKVSPNALSHYSYVVVREDHTRDVSLAELLEFFCRTPPLRQPQIIFVPSPQGSNLSERLRYANPAVTVIDVVEGRRASLQIPRSAPTSLVDFSDLYENRCFEQAGAVSTQAVSSWLSDSGRLPEVLVLGTRVRARLLTAERHHVEPDVDALLRRLGGLIESAPPDELEMLLHLRIQALLQKLFCSEAASHLTEAIALASSLGDELGLAACLRFAEFLDVHPALADHMYQRAERTFREHGALDLALYALNNRLVAGNAWRLPTAEMFEALLGEIGTSQPALYRRHDIFYNAGVQHLLASRLDAAFEVFTAPAMEEARPLVVASALLGKMICRHLAGAPPDAAGILDLVRYILEAVPRSNRWHVSNLLLNTLVLAQSKPTLAAEIVATAGDAIDVKGGHDVRDMFDENRRLAALVGLSNERVETRISGPFGDFQSRHGFALPYFFIWS